MRGISGLAALSVAVAVTVAGCASPPEPVAIATADLSKERGPIVLAAGPDDAGAWSAMAASWNRVHPDQPVTIHELSADTDRRHDDVAQVLRASSGEYTVVALNGSWVPEFASQGWLTKLTDGSLPAKAYVPSSWASGEYKGARYAYPVTADSGLLYYRKDLLAKAKLKVPTTWSALASACTKVLGKQHSNSCYGAGLAVSNDLSVVTAENILSAGGTLIGANGKPALTSAAAVNAVTWMGAATKTGVYSAKAVNWRDEQAVVSFTGGELLFLRSGTAAWKRAQSAAAGSKVVNKVGVARIPGRLGAGTPVAGGYQLAMSARARNQATAKDFLGWAAGPVAQRILLSAGSLAPALMSVYAGPGLRSSSPYLGVMKSSVLAAKVVPPTPAYAQASSAVADAIHPVLTGNTKPSDALNGLQARLEDILK